MHLRGLRGFPRARFALVTAIVALLPAGTAHAFETSTHELVAVADTWVSALDPTANFGASHKLRIDGSPVRRSYVKFEVPQLGRVIERATLEVYSRTYAPLGFELRTVPDHDWVESEMTYETAPGVSDVVGTSGPLKENRWSAIDVTSLVTGAGVVSFAFTIPRKDEIRLGSRELPDHEPRLVIETGELNASPVATDDVSGTDEDTPLAIPTTELTANDIDPEGQPLTVTGVEGTADTHGAVSLAGGVVTYTPDANFNGNASFGYTVSDGNGGTDGATVSVAVRAVNDAPTATGDAKVTDQDFPVTFPAADLRANDTDVDGDALTVTSVEATAETHGVVSLLDGFVTYAPALGYQGAASFGYTVTDTNGASASGTVAMLVTLVVPTVETQPMPHSGDAADDLAIWRHPTDSSLSRIIGTDKLGGLAVYNLAGEQVQYLADGRMNNVDLRTGFPLAGDSVALVAASDRSATDPARKWRIALYKVDPATGTLVNVEARTISAGFEPYGLCMYRSAASGKFYAFVTRRGATPPGGVDVEQWELSDNGAGLVDATKVRSFAVGSQSEGCVADDEHGSLFVAEEVAGIWKYGAGPDAGMERTQVDSTGPGGHLVADVEGMAIAYGPNGTGYLIVSSQGNASYAVYRREGGNTYVRSFRVRAGNGIDAVTQTDGLDVTTASLGSAFPDGVFVVQDDVNCRTEPTPCPPDDRLNQNFKLVPWQAIGLPL